MRLITRFISHTRIYFYSIALSTILLISACSSDTISSFTMATSVSSDGHYAITSHTNRDLILWDIKNKTKKIISHDANIYSAYFIKHMPYFMWQDDKTNQVIIESIGGRIIKQFQLPFPSYGEVITTDLKHYFASDSKWNLYEMQDNNKLILIKKSGEQVGINYGKLLNLILSNDNQHLLTSGIANADGDTAPLYVHGKLQSETTGMVYSLLNGVVLWNIDSGKPLRKFPGNQMKTIATLSPNGKYIISGDENTLLYIWLSKDGEILQDNYTDLFGKFKPGSLNKYSPDENNFVKDGFPRAPLDGPHDSPIFAIKFIDNNGHYLRFFNDVNNYVALCKVDQRIPIDLLKIDLWGYLPAGKLPPYVNNVFYNFDESIDTAPDAGILVTGNTNGGILVYKWDPKTLSLTRIWQPSGPPPMPITHTNGFLLQP